MYYDGKTESLKDLFGAGTVSLEPGRLSVDGRVYPIVDDVIILLEPSLWPKSLRERVRTREDDGTPTTSPIARDIQFTFGEEWKRFPEILPEHEEEFRRYFDLVDLGKLGGARVADLGCGIGRWSYFLKDACRELVLADFSDAVFVARRNLKCAGNVYYFLGDLTRLPFRDDFADFLFCLGVLHHLPTDALTAVRGLARCSREVLVFLYYALDNRPALWRVLLRAVSLLRVTLTRVHDPRARSFLTWGLTLGVYLPLIGLGHLLSPIGMAHVVPLHDFYRSKSIRRIRQDVYDRFFTGIEQRFRRSEIMNLQDTFRRVVVSEQMPFWHFLCQR